MYAKQTLPMFPHYFLTLALLMGDPAFRNRDSSHVGETRYPDQDGII